MRLLETGESKVILAYVHDPAVDVTKLLEAEQSCSMGRVIECEALQIRISILRNSAFFLD